MSPRRSILVTAPMRANSTTGGTAAVASAAQEALAVPSVVAVDKLIASWRSHPGLAGTWTHCARPSWRNSGFGGNTVDGSVFATVLGCRFRSCWIMMASMVRGIRKSASRWMRCGRGAAFVGKGWASKRSSRNPAIVLVTIVGVEVWKRRWLDHYCR